MPDAADPPERPVAEPRPGDERVEGHGPVASGVDRRRVASLLHTLVARVAEQPCLVRTELEPAVRERHPVTGPRGDPLDRKVASARLAEHDGRPAPGPGSDRG